MPVLPGFYGIIILMYFQQAEHNPPHVHALYGDDMPSTDIQTGEVLEGSKPQDRSSAYVGDAGV